MPDPIRFKDKSAAAGIDASDRFAVDGDSGLRNLDYEALYNAIVSGTLVASGIKQAGLQKITEKGSASGYASLDASVKVPDNQIPSTVERLANKGVANGYAGLDADGFLSSSNVSSDPGGTGAVTRSVEDKLRESVSVKDKGAAGDGVTIDTTAIQNAANETGVVVFPPGTYQIDDEITLSSNTTLILNSGVRINQTTANKSIFKATAKSNVWIVCNGAILHGEGSYDNSWTGNSGHLDRVVSFTSCNRCGITDPVIRNGSNAGLYLEDCEGFRGSNVRIEGTHTHGAVISASDNFQNGIYIKHGPSTGDCREIFLDFDISGTAQGILIESSGSYAGTSNPIRLNGLIHDIPGQHACYIQTGDIVGDFAVRNIALSGVKVQCPPSGQTISNFNLRVNAKATGSQAMEIQNANEGTHTGSSNAATLSDSTRSWTTDIYVGKTIYNLTDGSSGTITANTSNTITATLSGGSENDWDSGDVYLIGAFIDNLNIELVADGCSRGLTLDNGIRNLKASVIGKESTQHDILIQGHGHKDIDVELISQSAGRDAVQISATGSTGIKIRPTIREANASAGSYCGILIASSADSQGIEIHDPDITDADSNMVYGIFNQSSIATFGVYGKCKISGYSTNAIRTGTETLAFPTVVEFDDLATAYHDRTLIQSPDALVQEVRSTSTSPVTLWAKNLDDESAYIVRAEIVSKLADSSERKAIVSTVCAYRDGGGGATIQGSADEDVSIASASFAGVYAWDVSGNALRLRVHSGGTADYDWKVRVTVTSLSG